MTVVALECVAPNLVSSRPGLLDKENMFQKQVLWSELWNVFCRLTTKQPQKINSNIRRKM